MVKLSHSFEVAKSVTPDISADSFVNTISYPDFQVAQKFWGLPKWLSGKELTHQCRRHKRPWVGKIPGVGNGNPLQYSCQENSPDRGAWWVTVHGVTKS